MTKSKNYGFNLPSRDTDDIADINQIARNFEIIDEELYAVSAEAGEAGGIAEEARGYAARAYELVGEKASAITPRSSGDVITLSDASDLPLRDLKVYGKTTQASTPSPENPQALESPTEVVVKVMGANILPEDFWDFNSGKWTLRSDGYHVYHFDVPDGTAITVSAPHNTGEFAKDLYVNMGLVAAETKLWLYHPAAVDYNHNTVTVTAENGEGIYIRMYMPNGYLTALREAGLWVNVGTKTQLYEPYTEQSLALPILNEVGLAGVPVSSGGNYTDSKGQQWICDEIDFARGVYVQRCKEIIYSNEEITEPYMSTTGELTEGAKVLYVLAEPIETPLDEETLAAFAALHTNKPNTTITNDSGVWMSTEYVADTKLYIDNKFAELAAAIVSNS